MNHLVRFGIIIAAIIVVILTRFLIAPMIVDTFGLAGIIITLGLMFAIGFIIDVPQE